VAVDTHAVLHGSGKPLSNVWEVGATLAQEEQAALIEAPLLFAM